MTHADHSSPFDKGRPRPVATVLDTLRVKIDHDAFDGVVLWLECVAVDLGYGDIRALPGSLAWIDRLRAEGKRTALAFSGESADAAADLAGIRGRFDVVASGSRTADTTHRILEQLGVTAERAVVVDVRPDGLSAAHAAGVPLAIAVARGAATPAQLRDGGADTVVADLQELLGPTS
jgi:beta-phosphoglucomutase-like phosphatase (HAD superfamily)